MEWAAREALSWTDNILSGGGGGGGHFGLYPPPPKCTHFGLGSGMVFEATTEVYEGIYRFNSK